MMVVYELETTYNHPGACVSSRFLQPIFLLLEMCHNVRASLVPNYNLNCHPVNVPDN